MQEAAALTAKPIAGIKTVPGPDTNPLEWKMQVTAPAKYKPGGAAERDSPYAGRVFEVTIKFPTTYPVSGAAAQWRRFSVFRALLRPALRAAAAWLFPRSSPSLAHAHVLPPAIDCAPDVCLGCSSRSRM